MKQRCLENELYQQMPINRLVADNFRYLIGVNDL